MIATLVDTATSIPRFRRSLLFSENLRWESRCSRVGLVCGFDGGCGAHGVLAPGAETGHAASYLARFQRTCTSWSVCTHDDHPEHACGCLAVRGCGKGHSRHEEACAADNTPSSAEPAVRPDACSRAPPLTDHSTVQRAASACQLCRPACKAQKAYTEDITNQDRVAEPRGHLRGERMWVQLSEHRVHVS